jgi:hypothetical protein
MITADQLLAHAVGDYILQSDWMVMNKYQRSVATLVHAFTYAIPFLFLTQNPLTLAVIISTHFVIDRWRLARVVIWARNRPWPDSQPWSKCSRTGFPEGVPEHISSWLVIIVDNILHVTINGAAITYIG